MAEGVSLRPVVEAIEKAIDQLRTVKVAPEKEALKDEKLKQLLNLLEQTRVTCTVDEESGKVFDNSLHDEG